MQFFVSDIAFLSCNLLNCNTFIFTIYVEDEDVSESVVSLITSKLLEDSKSMYEYGMR